MTRIVPSPILTYYGWMTAAIRDGWTPDGIVGDGPPLYNVHEVTASWQHGKGLSVHVRGRARTKSGEPARNGSRGVTVDLSAEQPRWLRAVIDDARARLEVNH